MAYEEDLANRLRAIVGRAGGFTEKRMFGGLAFLVNGHLAVAASREGGLLLRVDPADRGGLLDHPHVSPFVMRGREMGGWLRIVPAGVEDDDEFVAWVERGVARAQALPPK